MEIFRDLPVLFCEEPVEFERWIEKNPDAPGVWLKFAKKNTGIKSINYDLALDVALCYGWIDTMSQKLDETYYLQKFTPRRAKSVWSIRNQEIVARLIKEGRMRPAGQKQIDAAKADGRWEKAYERQSNFVMPQDFLDKLAKNPKAAEFYETLNKANKFAIYYRLNEAKKPETRARRLENFITMLAEGKKLY